VRLRTGLAGALGLGLIAGCGLGGGMEVSKDAVDAVVSGADVVASGSYGNPAGAEEFRGQAFVVRPSEGMTGGTYIEAQLERLATDGWSNSREIDTVRYISDQNTEKRRHVQSAVGSRTSCCRRRAVQGVSRRDQRPAGRLRGVRVCDGRASDELTRDGRVLDP
jgi:hypothetical protein